MTTQLKLGDVVSAKYGNVTVTGKIQYFDGSGYIHLDFAEPQNLGNRIENEGVCIHPSDRWSVKLVKSGPELTWDDVGELPVSAVGGFYLKRK